MRFLFTLLFLFILVFGSTSNVLASENLIKVATFDSSRSPQYLLDMNNVPLYTNAGSSNIVENLKDLSKFGNVNGIVDCGVEFLPTVEEVLPGSLVDENNVLLADVFFGPLLNWSINSIEAEEISSFINAGGIVFVAESTISGGPKYNLLLKYLNLEDKWLEDNVYNPLTNFSTPHYAFTDTVMGPFGEVNILEHRTYRWLDKHDLVGVFMDFPDFSWPFVIAEKKFGKGYLAASSGQIYSNAFTGGDNDNLEYFLNMFAMGCKQNDTAVVLPVPSIKQYEDPWQNSEYDSAITNNLGCGESIGDCGCALTSASMVMGYYGINEVQNGLAMNPGNVNTHFIERNWYPNGNFSWWEVDNYTAQYDNVNGVKLDQPVRDSFDEGKIRQLIDGGIPVILKVSSPEVQQHFVVLKGYDEKGLIINDPANLDSEDDFTYLSDRGYVPYGNGKDAMIYYVEAHTDYSSFEIFSKNTVKVWKDDDEVGHKYIEGEGNYLGKEINIVEVQIPDDGVYLIEVEPNDVNECRYRIYGSNREGEVFWKDFDQCKKSFNFESEEGLSFDVEVDVRPANENNFVNGTSNSVFPVAIFGSNNFDVREINFTTVFLEGAEPFWAGKRRWLRDVNKDGYYDAILFFEREKMQYDFDGEACLVGKLTSGFGFWGCDELKLVSENI